MEGKVKQFNVYGLSGRTGITALAAAEVFLLGERLGADTQILMDTLGKGMSQSPALSLMSSGMLSRNFSQARVALRLLTKDLGLAHDLASEVGVALPSGTEALRIFERASSSGLDEHDVSSVLLVLEELTRKQGESTSTA